MELLRYRPFTPQEFRQITRGDVIAGREHHDPLDDVFQLPNVAGQPIIKALILFAET
jgi:hypothetical protein